MGVPTSFQSRSSGQGYSDLSPTGPLPLSKRIREDPTVACIPRPAERLPPVPTCISVTCVPHIQRSKRVRWESWLTRRARISLIPLAVG